MQRVLQASRCLHSFNCKLGSCAWVTLHQIVQVQVAVLAWDKHKLDASCWRQSIQCAPLHSDVQAGTAAHLHFHVKHRQLRLC